MKKLLILALFTLLITPTFASFTESETQEYDQVKQVLSSYSSTIDSEFPGAGVLIQNFIWEDHTSWTYQNMVNDLVTLILWIRTINSQVDSSNNNSNTTTNNITLENAKNIALQHAGVAYNDAYFTKTKSDFDDGISTYEIEFYYENVEYDYEINASNWNIMSFDNDIEYFTIPWNSNNNSTNSISVESAKNIALQHAGLSANNVRFTTVESDFDDGISVYEIEFYYWNMEYDYEINASNGNIMEYSIDRD